MRLTLIWTMRRIFLVMAATLLEIKSRAMLPRPPRIEEGEEDPEEALIRRLEEYKRFRETASAMKQFEQAAANLFTKLPEEYPLPPQETGLAALSLQRLDGGGPAHLDAQARERRIPGDEPLRAVRQFHRDEHNVQECMLTLLKGVSSRGCLRFEETFSAAPSKEEVVTLFLALLELLKLGEIHVEQEGTWSEIVLYPGRGKDVDEYGESATEETE